MEDNNKLYVFDKKEIALIFLFMIVIAITSFTLGVRIGKKMFFASQGVTEEDIRSLKLKSQAEEQVDSIVEKEKQNAPTQEEVSGDGFSKLQKEMEVLESNKGSMTNETDSVEAGLEAVKNTSSDKNIQMSSDEENSSKIGKFTIQLGSHPTLSEAKEFADAFTIRGYNPIISQVKVSGKTWYRVSLGSFNSMLEAKDYVKKEDSLFSGQEYVIIELK